MNVAVVTSTFPPYRAGISHAAFYESRELARQGHRVTVVTPRYGRLSFPPGWNDEPEITVRRLAPLFETGNAAVCSGLGSALTGVDAILLHYPFFGVGDAIALRLLCMTRRRRPRLVLRYDLDTVGSGQRRIIFWLHRRLMLPLVLHLAHRAIFSSEDYALTSHAASFVRTCPRQVDFIPYGVDRERFHPDPDTPKQAKSLLFVGSLDRAHYFKGLENLLQALAPLARQDAAIRLNVVGNGDLLPFYRDTARSLDISAQVHFMDACDDHRLRELYTASAATILPSIDRSESFGLVLIESMACGTAIVAPSLPGVRSLIRDGENGLLIPPCSADTAGAPYELQGLRSVLTRILARADETVAMGQHALAMVTDQYEWPSIAARIAASLAGTPAG